MSNLYNVMDENPNCNSGSNGCLCHELGGHDTQGPFLVFASTETDNIHAPFPVICAPCLLDAVGSMSVGRGELPGTPQAVPENVDDTRLRKTKPKGNPQI